MKITFKFSGEIEIDTDPLEGETEEETIARAWGDADSRDLAECLDLDSWEVSA